MGNEVAHAIKHRTMSREPRESGKMFRNYQQGKVPAAGGCTGMAHVFSTVIGKLQNNRRERGQSFLESACYRRAHWGSSIWRARASDPVPAQKS